MRSLISDTFQKTKNISFIEYFRNESTNKIPLGIYDLLQAGPQPVAGIDHGFPVEIGEQFHERVDEGLLSVMRGPFSVPLSHAPHKKVKGIQIWRAMGPYIKGVGGRGGGGASYPII